MEITGRKATSEEVPDITPAHPGGGGGRRPWVDYSPVATGEWHLVYEGGPESEIADMIRAYDRLKHGSRRWAERNGMTRSLRRRNADRRIWIRFTQQYED
jgi:hypothetical protein